MTPQSVPKEEPSFPCTLTLTIPFPTARLASTAHRALQVDAELSPLVRRSFDTTDVSLRVDYAATTPRMLRVAVNGFFESLGVVLGVMRDLDVDVVGDGKNAIGEGEGVQGLEVR